MNVKKIKVNDATVSLFFHFLVNYCGVNNTDNVLILDVDEKPMFSARLLDREILLKVKDLKRPHKTKEGE